MNLIANWEVMFEIMFGGVFALVGLGCLAPSICMFRGAIRKQRTWKSALGIVVGHAESIREGQRCYRPQVRFTALNGNQVVITASVSSTTHLNRIGDHVKILYDIANPDQGVIKSFSSLYMPGIIFAFFAVCFLVVGFHII